MSCLVHSTPHYIWCSNLSYCYCWSGEISSLEGTTQGDPLALSMYALAVVPLIRQLHSTVPDASQVWFADDAIAVATDSALLE